MRVRAESDSHRYEGIRRNPQRAAVYPRRPIPVRNSHDIYLVPGFFGFANLGKLTYFGHLRAVLAERCAAEGLAARIHAVKTHPTASLVKRSVRVPRDDRRDQ